MASLRGYTTAQNVRDFLGGQGGTLTDAQIETMISNVEGTIDLWIAGKDITFSSSKSYHLILRKAATAGTAILVLASSSASWQTLEQAVNARDIAIYEWETSYKLITGKQADNPIGIAERIVNA